ncbi:hypothetical protein Mal4_07790 [Maioricimonas rarisocia]|uniref:Uncharacterized protein n=1 Tax=Maioricimonas rarisocia TaxID=2528026 RepID=A0A517Z1Y5_9PLAN|nr:hypothetical protein Mal4_07790 [Maioricimonas rarisocia]
MRRPSEVAPDETAATLPHNFLWLRHPDTSCVRATRESLFIVPCESGFAGQVTRYAPANEVAGTARRLIGASPPATAPYLF